MKTEYFKIGQQVWHFGKIKGVVIKIIPDVLLPLICEFENGKKIAFTLDGHEFKGLPIPTLFQIQFELPKNEPLFDERPAYFYRSASETWIYDILCKIDEKGNGLAKNSDLIYSHWQYEPPILISPAKEQDHENTIGVFI